jgi:hypothetical protein
MPEKHPLEMALAGFLTDCDGLRSGYSNNIMAAVFAIATALSKLAAAEPPQSSDLADAIAEAGADIAGGLRAVAEAIKAARETASKG